MTKKGWFWAAIGGGVLLVAGGVTAAVLLTRKRGGGDTFDPELGTIGYEPMAAQPGFHF